MPTIPHPDGPTRAASIALPMLVHRHAGSRWLAPGDGAWIAEATLPPVEMLTRHMLEPGWFTMTAAGVERADDHPGAREDAVEAVEALIDRAYGGEWVRVSVLGDPPDTDQPDDWQTEGVALDPIPWPVAADDGEVLGWVDAHKVTLLTVGNPDVSYRWVPGDDVFVSLLVGCVLDEPAFILAPLNRWSPPRLGLVT